MSDDFDRDGWLDDVAVRLRLSRRGARFTQAEAAELIGVSRAALANIEAGRQTVKADVLWRLAIVYAVPVQRLMPEPLR